MAIQTLWLVDKTYVDYNYDKPSDLPSRGKNVNNGAKSIFKQGADVNKFVKGLGFGANKNKE